MDGEPTGEIREVNRSLLTSAMDRMGISVRMLSSKVGIPIQTVNRWRTHEAVRTKNTEAVHTIAALLRVNVDELAPVVVGSQYTRVRQIRGGRIPLKEIRDAEKELMRILDEDLRHPIDPVIRERMLRLVKKLSSSTRR